MKRALLGICVLTLCWMNVGCCQRFNCRGGCGGCGGGYYGDWYEGAACCGNQCGSCCESCCDPCDPCCRPVRNWWRRLFADLDRGRCCRTGCCDTGCSSCSSCSGGGCQDCQAGGGGYHASHGEVIHEGPHQPRQLAPKNMPEMPQERVAPPPVPPMTRGPAELNSRAVRSSPAPTPARRR
ncbi:MAG: hypothetical protein JNM18_17475, partial [Planctomycetaceae bacterium]|nr:hypothetical protein [Planctomycetaceae bacterium]